MLIIMYYFINLYKIIKMQYQMKMSYNKPNKKSYKIVVARYNEPIDWLDREKNNVIVYNKFYKLNISNQIMLNNVGRESETYLNYIIHNYENLPDVVIFTQARISDHKGYNDINYLIRLKEQAAIFGKSIPIVKHVESEFNKSCWDKDWNIDKCGNYFLANNYLNNEPIVFEDWFKRHILSYYPSPFHIYANAIFAVRKDLILKHPLQYYKYLINLVNHHINPAEGHFFERSWFYIFR
jgi:hypothetical protein